MENRTALAHRPGLVTRQIAGEILIVPIRHGVGDLSFIYTLNESGTRIWELIAERRQFAAIVSAICDEFEVPADAAAADLREFVRSLQEAGLVDLVSADGA